MIFSRNQLGCGSAALGDMTTACYLMLAILTITSFWFHRQKTLRIICALLVVGIWYFASFREVALATRSLPDICPYPDGALREAFIRGGFEAMRHSASPRQLASIAALTLLIQLVGGVFLARKRDDKPNTYNSVQRTRASARVADFYR